MIPLVLYEIDKSLLKECEEGESFSIWTKPEMDFFIIYRDDPSSERRKLATLLKADNPVVVDKLQAGYELWISLTWKGAIATLLLEEASPDEIAAARDRRREKARQELSKSVRPTKREFTARIRLTDDHHCQAGEQLTFLAKPIERYLDMQYSDLEFLSNFKIVGWLHASGDLRTRILRAYFSGYDVTVRIVETMPGNRDDEVPVLISLTPRG